MTPDRFSRQAGAALRQLRRERGLRLSVVAARAGMPAARLSQYENGRRALTCPVLVQLLVALGCSIKEFCRHFGPWGEASAMLRRQSAVVAAITAGTG